MNLINGSSEVKNFCEYLDGTSPEDIQKKLSDHTCLPGDDYHTEIYMRTYRQLLYADELKQGTKRAGSVNEKGLIELMHRLIDPANFQQAKNLCQQYEDEMKAQARLLEDDALWRSGLEPIKPEALQILENFLHQHRNELPKQIADNPDNPLNYPRLEEKIRTYRRLLVYSEQIETDEMAQRANAHQPIKIWERGLGELYKGLGSPGEVDKVLALIGRYRSDKKIN